MDDEGFVALVTPHITDMLRVAATLVGAADAENLTQEATVRAWRAWSELRGVGAVRSWLLRITINVCYSWNKSRHGNQQRRMIPLDEETIAVLRLPGADPGDSDHARALDLYAAIDALPRDLRTIVMLRYFIGMDATEIGAVMDVPPGTIRARLRRALDLLRHRLTPTSSERSR